VSVRAALGRAFLIFYAMPKVRRKLWHAWYYFLARRYRDRFWTFMNYGYRAPEGSAPLALTPTDEADRSHIELYNVVARGVDLSGRDVLEIGSGRGGGASFIARYLRPRRMVGVDLSAQAVALCCARHAVPGLSFEVGDAERLAFDARSFDAVLNVESSHCYGDFAAFLSEVRRVLRPGGWFLYADFRARDEVESWRAQLSASGLERVTERDLTAGVLAALDADDSAKRGLIENFVDRPLKRVFGQFAGLRGSALYNELRCGSVTYHAFVLRNSTPAGAGECPHETLQRESWAVSSQPTACMEAPTGR
jgi:SAM-dependent methyltransferase